MIPEWIGCVYWFGNDNISVIGILAKCHSGAPLNKTYDGIDLWRILTILSQCYDAFSSGLFPFGS